MSFFARSVWGWTKAESQRVLIIQVGHFLQTHAETDSIYLSFKLKFSILTSELFGRFRRGK